MMDVLVRETFSSVNRNACRAILPAPAVKLPRLIVSPAQQETTSSPKLQVPALATTSVLLTVIFVLSQIIAPRAMEISHQTEMAVAAVSATDSSMESNVYRVLLHVTAAMVRIRHVLTARITIHGQMTELSAAILALTVQAA